MLKKTILTGVLALLLPIVAQAQATIDATLIPDGTYTVKVTKVVDAKHVVVSMDNGTSTTLTAGRPTIDFSTVKPNDQLKLSIAKGAVLVYIDLSK